MKRMLDVLNEPLMFVLSWVATFHRVSRSYIDSLTATDVVELEVTTSTMRKNDLLSVR